MKKILAFILASLTALSVVSCQKQEDDTKASSITNDNKNSSISDEKSETEKEDTDSSDHSESVLAELENGTVQENYDNLIGYYSDGTESTEYTDSNGIKYRIRNDFAVITSVENCESDIINIPEYEGEYPVKAIDEHGLYVSFEPFAPDVRFTLPDTIEYIAPDAINIHSNSLELFLPENLKIIDHDAINVDDCIIVHIPSSVEYIGENALHGDMLQSVIVDERNKFYSSYSGCVMNKKQTEYCIVPNGINMIEIPDTVQILPEDCFNALYFLRHVKIGSGVKTMESGCLENCNNLKDLYIPSNVTNIGKRAFGCYIDRGSVGGGWTATVNDDDLQPHPIKDVKIYGETATEAYRYALDNDIAFEIGNPENEMIEKNIIHQIQEQLPASYHDHYSDCINTKLLIEAYKSGLLSDYYSVDDLFNSLIEQFNSECYGLFDSSSEITVTNFTMKEDSRLENSGDFNIGNISCNINGYEARGFYIEKNGETSAVIQELY